MKNMKMKIVVGLMILAVSGVAAYAASLTGTVDRLLAESAGWSKKYQDQSVYPHQNSRSGNIIRFYDFSIDGGAASTISLERGKVVQAVPDNTIIWDGHIEVMTALTGASTPTATLGVVTSWDLMGTGTTLNSTGIKDITPDGTAANAIKCDGVETTRVSFVNAVTAGVFFLHMEARYGQ